MTYKLELTNRAGHSRMLPKVYPDRLSANRACRAVSNDPFWKASYPTYDLPHFCVEVAGGGTLRVVAL